MANILEESDQPLSEKLGHLLNRLTVAMRADKWETTGSLGINPTQGQVLLLLYRRTTAMRLSEIAEELAVSSATVSDSVASLVEKEFVTKKRAIDDGRALAVTLTPKGKNRVAKIEQNDDAVQLALATLNQKEQVQFYRTLINIVQNLQNSGRIPIGRMCVTCRYFVPNQNKNTLRPHFCSLVGSAFGDKTLRSDCPEHEAASVDLAESNWKKFAQK